MLKRAHTGTFHKISEKHLQRYDSEFAGRYGIRDRDTRDQMGLVTHGLVWRLADLRRTDRLNQPTTRCGLAACIPQHVVV